LTIAEFSADSDSENHFLKQLKKPHYFRASQLYRIVFTCVPYFAVIGTEFHLPFHCQVC